MFSDTGVDSTKFTGQNTSRSLRRDHRSHVLGYKTDSYNEAHVTYSAVGAS
jgi:hypothetical protein